MLTVPSTAPSEGRCFQSPHQVNVSQSSDFCENALGSLALVAEMAMGQNHKPVPPVNIPIQLKYVLNWVVLLPTKMVPLVLTHSQIEWPMA